MLRAMPSVPQIARPCATYRAEGPVAPRRPPKRITHRYRQPSTKQHPGLVVSNYVPGTEVLTLMGTPSHARLPLQRISSEASCECMIANFGASRVAFREPANSAG